jgi:hypothetical protein
MPQNPTSETPTKTADLERLRRHDLAKLKRGFAGQILKQHRYAMRHATKAKSSLTAAMQAAFDCGRLLTQQQTQLGRKGNFDAWCAKYLPEISRRTIYNYKSLFEQVTQYLEAKPADVQPVALCDLNFPSLRQMYIAFGILPDHEQNGEPKPDRSFLEPLLKVLASSRFERLKDDSALEKLSRDELFMLDRSLMPFIDIHQRIAKRLSMPSDDEH